MMRRLLVTILLVASLTALFNAAAFGATQDFGGDGRADLAASYRYNGAAMGLWTFTSGGTALNPTAAPTLAWASAPGAWDAWRSTVVSGNFAGDNRADFAVWYDYGRATSGLWVFETTDSGYVPRRVWVSSSGGWDAARSKIVAGHFSGGAYDDIAVFYDYGRATTGIWIFSVSGPAMTPHQAFNSGVGSWDASRSKLAVGDFSGDSLEDLAVLYDYGYTTAAAWVFQSNGVTLAPHLAWSSGQGNWSVTRSKMAAGNFSGDAHSDLAILYDYGNAKTGVWVLTANAGLVSPHLFYASGAGNWDTNRSKVAAGHFTGGVYDDVAVVYDYGYATSAAWFFTSSGSAVSPHLAWSSGYGRWDWARTKVAGSATFFPRYGVATSKVIDINLSSQSLVCNENVQVELDEGIFGWRPRAVFSTLVSSGKAGFSTPTGNFSVYAKDPVVDMSGFGGTSEYYYVPNVPYVLWFYGNYSIHGAYWHNDFGSVRSHGCVNVPVDAGAWIYSWAPVGTPVIVHY